MIQPPEWTVLSNLFPGIHHLPELSRQRWMQQNFDAETTLFEAGQSCQRFVLLGAGNIRIQMTKSRSRRMTLYRLTPGQLCLHSIMNLINQENYAFEAVTETEGWLSWVPAEQFREWMAESQDFQGWILASIGERFKQLIDRTADLAFTPVELRLADHLIERMGEDAVVNTTQAELAREIGSAREVVSRHIHRWEKLGWVEKSRGHLKLVDIEALLALLDEDRE